MNYQQYEKLIKKLERKANKNYGLYKFKVKILALLGYGFIVLIILGLVTLLVLLVWLFQIPDHLTFRTVFAFVVCVLILIRLLIIICSTILKTLFLTIPAPQGLELTRHEVPELFELINRMRQELDIPPFKKVLLTHDFNAAVCQVSPTPLLGLWSNYLILGLPLMQALSPVEFKAVLGHELGHISGNHSRFANWIYKMRLNWRMLLESLERVEEDSMSRVFADFFSWYAPYFNAYSFVLARRDEYEADQCSAQLVGKNITAETLIKFEIKSALCEKYWSQLYQQAITVSEPPQTAFTDLTIAVKNNEVKELEQRWLVMALAKNTDYHDTHPCLTERLLALDYNINHLKHSINLPKSAKVSAADKYLGNALPQLTNSLNLDWLTVSHYQWKEYHQEQQKLIKELEKLEAKGSSLHIEEVWKKAILTMRLKDNTEAIAALKDVLALQPHHEDANYCLGQILLEVGDETGITHLEMSMKHNLEKLYYGCQLIYIFLLHQGKDEEAQSYLNRSQKVVNELKVGY